MWAKGQEMGSVHPLNVVTDEVVTSGRPCDGYMLQFAELRTFHIDKTHLINHHYLPYVIAYVLLVFSNKSE